MQKALKKGKGWVKLTVDPKIYSLATVYSAGYVFLDRGYIYLDKDSKARIIIWLFPKNKKENLDKLGMDFYNELLNYAHYFSRIKTNAEVIKLLLQRALFSANPSLVAQTQKEETEDLLKELEKIEEKKNNKKEKSFVAKKRK